MPAFQELHRRWSVIKVEGIDGYSIKYNDIDLSPTMTNANQYSGYIGSSKIIFTAIFGKGHHFEIKNIILVRNDESRHTEISTFIKELAIMNYYTLKDNILIFSNNQMHKKIEMKAMN